MIDDTDPSDPQEGFLARPMGLPGICLFGLYFAVLSVAAIWLLWAVWPTPEAASPPGAAVFDDLAIEYRLILIAMLSGALGAFIHGATSFATYLGNRSLKRSWAWWYLLRPFIGMALGLIFYFLVRGGFLSPQADGSQISPFGVAAVAGLVGLFSKQATDKLKDVFEQIFPTDADRRRADPLEEKEGNGEPPTEG